MLVRFLRIFSLPRQAFCKETVRMANEAESQKWLPMNGLQLTLVHTVTVRLALDGHELLPVIHI
jgi:hypothetical protein